MILSQGSPVRIGPDGYGDRWPQSSGGTYAPPLALQLAQAHASYGQIYRSQLWVAVLVNKLGAATARLPLKVYRRTDGGREDASDSEYGRLLGSPNRKHDPFFFWLWVESTLEIYGEAILFKLRPTPGAPPIELWPVHPSRVDIYRRDDGTLMYRYQGQPDTEWPESDVIHFRLYNPDDMVRGLSRLEPLRPTLTYEDAMRRAQTSFWGNGARPSTLLESPDKMSQQAYDRLKASWESTHAGVDSWGKTAILEDGVKANVLQLNANELSYIESRKINREEACSIFDVPPPVVHILDRATFSNITEQMRSMYRDTMAPKLRLFESALAAQLRPDFDIDASLYAEFLLDEVLRGDFEARSSSYQTAIQAGWMTPAEVRARENLPDAGPETHQLYGNAALVPLGSTGGADLPVRADGTVDQPLVARACQSCHVHTSALSRRGFCRSCEGRRGRKELTQ